MPELTFGRPRVYAKVVTPEIEAKREAERNLLRATLTPAYVRIYNEGVVPCSDEEIIATSNISPERFFADNPGTSLVEIKNAIFLAQKEWEVRKKHPIV